MSLPQPDLEFLERRNLPHQIADEAGMTCVVLEKWALPAGLNETTADLLVRLQPGYPDLPPDMWWFGTPLRYQDGREIAATQVTEAYLGRSWQRWSRHLAPDQWRSGVDGLESYVALIDRELMRTVEG